MIPSARWLTAVVLMLGAVAPVIAQKYDGVAIKSGRAAFTYSGKDLVFASAEGGLQQMQGFTVATLVFRPDPRGKDHLNLVLMYQAPGKVDLDGAFSTSGISMFSGGDVSRFTKGKSKCTITLSKATATELEGSAECPLLHNIDGAAMPAVTNLKFSATTK